MIAQEDRELMDWLLGVELTRPPQRQDFLHYFASAVLQADEGEFRILRPALLEIKKRYPNFSHERSITWVSNP